MAYYPAIAVNIDIVACLYNINVLEGCQKIWETSEGSNLPSVQQIVHLSNLPLWLQLGFIVIFTVSFTVMFQVPFTVRVSVRFRGLEEGLGLSL